MHPPENPWNHNLHYLPLLLAAVPAGCERALDVGCGEGILTRALARRVSSVTGIDRDPGIIALARSRDDGGGIDYVCADFMAAGFEPASFQFVASVAALHHMDEPAALERMADMLAPGGCLAVLGIPRRSLPRELPRDLAAAAVHRLIALRRGIWETPAPVVAPRLTHAEVRRIVKATLPQARLRRHLLWRYSLIWTKPG